MRKSKFKHMSRDQVVASMARKLADSGNGDFVVTSQKPSLKKVFVILSIILLVFASLTGVFFTRTSSATLSGKSQKTEVMVQNNPLHKLREAFRDQRISADQYALYLEDLLIRYDSLPQQYKVSRPMVKGDEVFHEYRDIWPKLSLRTRAKLVKDLPNLESWLQRRD